MLAMRLIQTSLTSKYIYLVIAGSVPRGTHNLATSDEVAIILPGDGSEALGAFDTVVHSHQGGLHRVNMLSGVYEPLHFPLLFR